MVGKYETVPKGNEKTGVTGNLRKNVDHSDHSIVQIVENTESILQTWKDLLLEPNERPPAYAGVKNSQY